MASPPNPARAIKASPITLGTAYERLSDYAPTREKFVSRVNLACELLMIELAHKQTLERAVFSVFNGLLTLPRQYFGCVGLASNNTAIRIWNQWWEFLASGPGLQTRVWGMAEDLGDGWVTFKDIASIDATGCYLKVLSDTTETTSDPLLIKGLDENGETLRTGDGAAQISGEEVPIDNTGNWTENKFTDIDQIVKPLTNGRVRLYASATSGDPDPTLIGIYEPDELDPSWRRYRVPRSDDSAVSTSVEALCQLRSVWLTGDDSPLPIGNLNALRDALLALHYKDNNDAGRHDELMSQAVATLRAEHRRYHPASSFVPGIDFIDQHPEQMF